ncbi:class I SAM-dependent methyltransferase [Streptomyces wuyuanensis]|uniref:class I SAM-dependent methyltransferase n=1 Tax=Streptomyces wuyuanensis TaxID=1196353 RepID=UPI0034317FE0
MATTSDAPRGHRYAAGLLDHQHPTEEGRLRALEAFADPGTCAVLKGQGIEPGWRCLEVGGGAGSVAKWLAEQSAPGEVVVTDIDTTLLPRDIPNLTVLRHDVVKESFPEQSFDLVHTRAVLEHLPERDEVVSRIVEWLRPGGRMCVDGALFLPPPTSSSQNAYHRCLGAASALTAGRMGSDVQWAPALPRLFAEAGLEQIRVSCTTGLIGPGGNADAMMRLSFGQLGPAMVETGLVSEQDLAECMRLMADPEYVDSAYLIFVHVTGRRPE